MQPNQQLQITDGTVLDPKVVKVMRAIRQVESGGNYNAVGDAGAAHGAFQYNEQTGPGWKNIARQYLGDENAPMDQANQNKATYYRIKEWKDQGRDPEEIAALWNGASKDPQTGRYVYNNPEYGEKFRAALTGGSLGGTYQQPPQPEQYQPATTGGYEQFQNQIGTKQGGFLDDVGESLVGVGQGIDEASRKVATNEINVGSGFLQGAGAVAGGVGDVIDDTLSNIPVFGGLYQGATELIGGAVQGAMNTGPGQAAQAWAEEHPEAAGNIGAVANIASLIPIFRGLKQGKTGLQDLRTTATKEATEASAIKELEASLNKPQRRILERSNSRGQDALGLIVRNQEYLPDVIEKNGKYYFDTAESTKALQRSIDADEQALQNLLESTMAMNPDAKGIAFNINDVAKKTMDDVLEGIGRTGGYDAIKDAVTRYFDSYKKSMQGVEFINLSELNDIKRDVRKAINFDAIDPTGTLAKEAQMTAGQSLMKQVEDAAKKAGVEGVSELNKKMGEGLTALKLLEHLGDGKVIKSGSPGLVKSISKETPIVSGLVDYATKGAPSTPTTRLKRKRPLRETGRRGLVQLGTGMALSGQLQSEPVQ